MCVCVCVCVCVRACVSVCLSVCLFCVTICRWRYFQADYETQEAGNGQGLHRIQSSPIPFPAVGRTGLELIASTSSFDRRLSFVQTWRTLTPRKCAFLPCGHLDFQSAATAHNDEFKACFHSSSSTSLTLSLLSDQCRISPAASPVILHRTVWGIWLFIAYSDERGLYYQFSLPHQCISL